MTYKPDIMIYHANCADGFGAAWAAWMKWGDTVEYVPCSYGQEPPDLTGKHVLIGDFSFKREAMERYAQTAKSIIVLDHHATAKQELAQWICSGDFFADNVAAWIAKYEKPVALFDMDRSGAVMVWQFCHPDTEVPMLLRLIEDRDLWRFVLPETKPFNVWLRCEPFDFEGWGLIAQRLNEVPTAREIMAQAYAMQRFFDQKVQEMARRTRHMRIGGHVVPACNCPPEFCSEVAHAILERNQDAAFAACYWDTRDGRQFSLRSDNAGQHRCDVAEIAAKAGGGGHRNAAGFGVPLP